MRMTTNKIQNFFGHSRGGGNPVVVIILLVVLLGTVLVPSGFVLAGPPGIEPGGDGSGDIDLTGDIGPITTFSGLLTHIVAILNVVVPFLVALAVFVIMWGVFGYIRHSAEEEKRAEAKMFVVWGVVGVFIMVSIWGFINILVNTLPLHKKPPKVESVFPK